MTTITIPGNVYNALRACTAADDEVRYHLRGILVDFANELFVATDGHRLLKYAIDKTASEIADDLPDMLIATTSRKADREGSIVLTIDAAGVEAATATSFSKTGKQKWSELVEVIDGKFPDYDKVIPPWTKMAEGETVPAVAYNPVLIGDVVKALTPDGIACRVYPTADGKGACRVKIAGFPDAELILMPMRWDPEAGS